VFGVHALAVGLNNPILRTLAHSACRGEAADGADAGHALLLVGRDREAQPTFAAAILEHVAASLGLQALPETMGSEPADVVGLIRTLHGALFERNGVGPQRTAEKTWLKPTRPRSPARGQGPEISHVERPPSSAESANRSPPCESCGFQGLPRLNERATRSLAMRDNIRLISSAGTGFIYYTTKNKRTQTTKLELKKYDPVVRQHVVFKEAKMPPHSK
jgi:large subunit ribosomal protein L33